MRRLATLALILAASLPATAAARAAPPAEPQPWPFPPPDPVSWWTEPRPPAPEAADPLGGRRPGRGERPADVDSGIGPSLYRLWGLPPLQGQILAGDEMILELWARPARSVRQTVVRIVVRRDGRAFVQARAGLACCEPQIARRIGFDAELPAGQGRRFLALRDHPMWRTPRAVRVDEGGGTAEAVCVDGASYDLVLVLRGLSVSLRRACHDAAIGQIAEAAEPILAAALGREPRFDVLFPRGADFTGPREAYRALIAAGGRLTPDPDGPAAAP